MTIEELAWMLVAEMEMVLFKDESIPKNFPWITAMHYARQKGGLVDVEA